MTTPAVTKAEPSIKTTVCQKLTWVNIERPTEAETSYLAEHYPFHPLDLDDCLSRIQLPKLDEYDDYIFMVFHFPVFNPQARVTTSSQVSIFVGEDYLITLHQGDLKPLVNMFKSCQSSERAREESMGRSSGYLLYLILDRLVNYCFPILNKIGDNIEAVEERIFRERPRGTVKDMAVLRRDLISFRRIIRPQTEAVELLEQREWPILKEDPDVYFGDIADHLRKIRDTLDDYKEVVEGLNDTNNAVTSFRTNDVIRVLTIISTIMLPLTLIASVLGMNVYPMPIENPAAFAVIMVGMLGLIGAMLVFFRSRHWI
ncbi:MAG: magnesium transporter CorA family protein [Chloroflexota bacterium]|nr:magnesium transporter CorA family protein [Chloroflexota bacterium]